MNDNKIYYFDDKDLFDAVYSARRNISDLWMRDQALERGVFFSYGGEEYGRRHISDFYSIWFNDHAILCAIKEKLSIGQRRPRYEPEYITPISVEKPISADDLQAALQSSKDALSAESAQSLEFVKNTDGSFRVTHTHTEMDYSQTTLRQEKQRTDAIDVRLQDGGLVISAPHGNSGDAVKKLIVQNLSAANPTRKRIELCTSASDEARFVFIQRIIEGMAGLTLETVTEVRMASNEVETDGEHDTENDVQAAKSITQLLKLHLQGSNLFETDEFKELKSKGFFPSEVRWWAQDNVTHELIEFSAGFSEAKAGKGFKSDALAVKKWNLTKKENYKSKEVLKGDDHIRYKRILESTVFVALDEHEIAAKNVSNNEAGV
jgi:hypothetical protein